MLRTPGINGFLFLSALFLGSLAGFHPRSIADEIEFIEKFALAEDREAVLKELIPGTEDYYYFHCLHYQNTEQFDKAEEMIDKWIRQHDYQFRASQSISARAREIVNRQMLLTYPRNPQRTLDYLTAYLKLQFNHQRESLDGSALPSVLDPELISRSTLTAKALARHAGVQGFEDAALAWLLGHELDNDDLYDALKRIHVPDHPRLVESVNRFLSEDVHEFGQLDVHQRLTRQQLLELTNLKPRLMDNQNFVNIYLTRIRPNPDIDFQSDPAAQREHLTELWDFAKRLSPSYNTLKAHVLYHRLVFDRTQGIHDRERFLEYLQLPREAFYIEPKYHRQPRFQNAKVNFNQDFQALTLYPGIGDDEPLIRDYLQHFFIEDQDYTEFEKYLKSEYLKRHYAETKIVNGLGDREDWASYLSAIDYQQLRNRVDLDFVPTSRRHFSASDPVSIEMEVKNVDKLIVKVFEINTLNYYRDLQKEIDTSIVLDGLQPNQEYTFEYDENPFRRVKRKFDFPELDRGGVYVVDFIGNRKSSRALIRKGRLRYLEEVTPAGQQLTIIDGQNQPVKGASVWMQGTQFTADENGQVMIPFSNQPGKTPLILSNGQFSSFDYFMHQAESYDLRVGFFVDRESLISRHNARLVVRPQLRVNGIPTSIDLLKDVRLLIASSDLDGSVATREIKDFKLYEDRESEFEFKVPDRLQGLTFTLTGAIQNLSQNEEITLTDSDSFFINTIDTDVQVEDLHLTQVNGQYHLDLLGKNGEIRTGRPVQFNIKHRDFKDPVQVALQTNMNGRIQLGSLADIDSLEVVGPESTTRKWDLNQVRTSYYSSMFAPEGEPVSVPLPADDLKLSHETVALLEVRGGTYTRNLFSTIQFANGLLTLKDLPRGDYRLFIKNVATIDLKIVKGETVGSQVMNDQRQVELKSPTPLQIIGIDRNESKTAIRVSGADKFTRVHVVATRFVPRFNPFHQLVLPDSEPALTLLPQSESLYVVGRKIGDEYQYILDRKYAEKFPGVMLSRPGLLLQPWAVRTTETTRQEPDRGTDFAGADRSSGSRSQREGKPDSKAEGKTDPSSLDFLEKGSVVLANLELDENGRLELDNEAFAGKQHLHVCIVSPTQTVAREISFDEQPIQLDDQRLVLGLDPENRYARKKEISFVDAGESFEITDIATGEFQLYDNLPDVYQLFSALTEDAKLREFRFVLTWNDQDQAEKTKLYSKYACHELNFFLFKKDPEFFQQVIKPYLANKKDKQFLDRWLLGMDLKEFRQPWRFERLNTVEKILLAQSLEAEKPYTTRFVLEAYNLNPTPQSRFDTLFGYALQGNALDTDQGPLTETLSRLKEASRDGTELKLGMQNAPQPESPADAPMANNRAAATPAPSAGGGFGGGRGGISRGKPSGQAKEEMDAEAMNSLERQLGQSGQGQALAEKAARKRGNGRFDSDADKYFRDFEEKRKQIQQLFRQVEKTMEWAENNYYHLTIDQHVADLVQVNRFWRDYVEHPNDEPFHSVNVAEASRNFTEMMFALSVLDLKWEPGKHDTREDENRLVLTAAQPLLIYHDQIRPAEDGRKETSVLVSQNFFRVGDRYRYDGPDRLDKFVTDEFIQRTAYGCQVVVTNPTSAKQKIDVLLQIPRGSLPLKSTRETRSVHLELDPYNTTSLEYYFYFPESGEYAHYPVNVARNEKVIAFAESMKFQVVEQPSKVDKSSWDYVSQFGTEAEVVQYLEDHNLQRTDLGRIAWRMKDREFFQQIISWLDRHHRFHPTLWAYAVQHNAQEPIRQLLTANDEFVGQTGPYINTDLLTNDRVARHTYEHLEYEPLVNARVHQLGAKRQILNDRFFAQYHRLLWILGCKRQLDHQDQLAVCYYLLLQDRIAEARDRFQNVSPDQVPSRLQYDYMAAYLDMFNPQPELAGELVAKYQDYQVDRWKKAFAEIQNQLNEINGQDSRIVDETSRENVQDQLAAQAPTFDFQVDAKQVSLTYRNLDRVLVNYYVMDVELLFSRNPFVQQYSGELTYIRPRKSEWIELAGDGKQSWQLPEELQRSNVLIEIQGGDQIKSQAYYAHAMSVQLVESYGQLRVQEAKTGRNVPRTYCKIYARMKDGQVRFYKDGYTDLRGRFDYASLSTNDLDNVEKFSVLILDEELGATVREALPPKR